MTAHNTHYYIYALKAIYAKAIGKYIATITQQIRQQSNLTCKEQYFAKNKGHDILCGFRFWVEPGVDVDVWCRCQG